MITHRHPEWPATRRHLEEKIAEWQRQLEAPGLPLDHTEGLRGRIAAYRSLIAEVEPTSIEVAPRSYTNNASRQ